MAASAMLHYKSSTNQAPRRADHGWPGEERWIWLRLKLIADAGLVGPAQCRQIDAARRGVARAAQDRRLSLHHPEAAARRGAASTATNSSGRPARPDRRRQRRRRPRPPLPRPCRALRRDPPSGRRAPRTMSSPTGARCGASSTPMATASREKREIIGLNKIDAVPRRRARQEARGAEARQQGRRADAVRRHRRGRHGGDVAPARCRERSARRGARRAEAADDMSETLATARRLIVKIGSALLVDEAPATSGAPGSTRWSRTSRAAARAARKC